MATLLTAVIVSLCVSAMCSLMEAALFAVPLAHVKHLADQGSKSGKLLADFKENISRPIAAILILNTISHTVGAAVAGASAAVVFGDAALILFSLIFTLLILYLSEIIPKQIGVTHCRKVAELTARWLWLLIMMMYPLVRITEYVSQKFGKGHNEPSISEAEVISMTEIGQEEGVLDELEGSVITNVIGLDNMAAKDVLTPRVVVFRLNEEDNVSSVREDIQDWNFTRVPLFNEKEPDVISSYVTQRDIYRALLKDNGEAKFSELARPLTTVSEFLQLDELLLQMFEQGEHVVSVVDEHGGFAGIVSLEDIIEEVVGQEIVDEYDFVDDMRVHAKKLVRKKRVQQRKSNRNRG